MLVLTRDAVEHSLDSSHKTISSEECLIVLLITLALLSNKTKIRFSDLRAE
jgi:hypothetical protein